MGGWRGWQGVRLETSRRVRFVHGGSIGVSPGGLDVVIWVVAREPGCRRRNASDIQRTRRDVGGAPIEKGAGRMGWVQPRHRERKVSRGAAGQWASLKRAGVRGQGLGGWGVGRGLERVEKGAAEEGECAREPARCIAWIRRDARVRASPACFRASTCVPRPIGCREQAAAAAARTTQLTTAAHTAPCTWTTSRP